MALSQCSSQMDASSTPAAECPSLRRGGSGRSLLKKVGVALVALSMALGSASAATYTCSDAVCIQAKLGSVSAGDRILVAPGTYTGIKQITNYNRAAWFSTTRSGTAAMPITLDALDPANKPVLQGDSSSDGYVFHMVGANYWTVRNIVFRNGAKGFIMDGCNYNVLDGIEVSNVGDEGVHFRDGSSYNLLNNSRVSETGVDSPGFGEGVYIGSAMGTNYPGTSTQINQACHFNRVTRCVLGPNVRAEHVDVKERTRGTVVEGCTLLTAGLSGANSADSAINVKGNDVLISNNIVVANTVADPSLSAALQGTAGSEAMLYAFKQYPVYTAGAESGLNVTFADNQVLLGPSRKDVFILYVQLGLVGLVSNNVRDYPGNMYSGATKDVTPPAVPLPKTLSTYTPTGDALVRDAKQASISYGLDPLLSLRNKAGSMRLSLVQFPLSFLTNRQVSTAVLRLYVEASASTTLQVFPTTGTWSETSVTYNTRPSVGTTVLASVALPATSDFVPVDLDITAHVRALASAGASSLQLALQELRGKYTEILANEHPSGNGPKLVIVTA